MLALPKKHVFISHSHFDDAIGMRLCAALEKEGIRCWYSSRPSDLEPGAEWDERIDKALSESAALILIFSANSNKSKWVRREVALADQRELSIYPVRIEDVPKSGPLHSHVVLSQWIDAVDGPIENHLGPVIECLRGHFPQLKACSPTDAALDVPDAPPAPPTAPQPNSATSEMWSAAGVPHAFICHARQDAGIAARIRELLKLDGIECWTSLESAQADSKGTESFTAHMERSAAVFLVFSAAAAASFEVRLEMGRASRHNLKIFAIRTDHTVLSGLLEIYLLEAKWIDFSSLQDDLEPFLDRAIQRPRPSTEPQTDRGDPLAELARLIGQGDSLPEQNDESDSHSPISEWPAPRAVEDHDSIAGRDRGDSSYGGGALRRDHVESDYRNRDYTKADDRRYRPVPPSVLPGSESDRARNEVLEQLEKILNGDKTEIDRINEESRRRRNIWLLILAVFFIGVVAGVLVLRS